MIRPTSAVRPGCRVAAGEEVETMTGTSVERVLQIPAGGPMLEGVLEIPPGASGVVLFAHGSGSGRHSPRNTLVARVLQRAGVGTLLFDLLTPAEDVRRESRFDIETLTARLVAATDWLQDLPAAARLTRGYFGASTGAAAALCAAARRPSIAAVVSRGGRPDLAMEALPRVQAPTLLIVGGYDAQVLDLNRSALAALRCEKELVVVPGATHLFEEPGALEEVASLAAGWLARHLAPRGEGA